MTAFLAMKTTAAKLSFSYLNNIATLQLRTV